MVTPWQPIVPQVQTWAPVLLVRPTPPDPPDPPPSETFTTDFATSANLGRGYFLGLL